MKKSTREVAGSSNLPRASAGGAFLHRQDHAPHAELVARLFELGEPSQLRMKMLPYRSTHKGVGKKASARWDTSEPITGCPLANRRNFSIL